MEALIDIEKVERNNDLLTAILIRLPPKSIFRFRSVLRRWNNIITNDSFFLQSYSDRRKKEHHSSLDPLMTFILTELPVTTISTMDMKMKHVPISFGKIINYSNGLILVGHGWHYSTSNLRLFNPLTGKSTKLPPPSRGIGVMGLVCEENNTNQLVPNYRVVAAAINRYTLSDNALPMETYSSKTRKWEKLKLMGTGKFALFYKLPALVFNGVFHWNATEWHLAVYDSNNGGGNHVQLIELPYDQETTWTTSTWSSSDGVLWFGCGNMGIMRYWMLPKGGRDSYRRSTTIPKTEWILMHTINYASLLRHITTIFERSFSMGSFELSLIPRNPFVSVITVQGEKLFFVYDIESKSIDFVKCHGRPFWLGRSSPYMESLSLSSYAFSPNVGTNASGRHVQVLVPK